MPKTKSTQPPKPSGQTAKHGGSTLPAADVNRLSVQTVRMDAETLKALQYASIERRTSQQKIILAAVRKELGLE